jgi:hypothetical protein
MKILLIFDNFIFFIKRIHYELLNIMENRYLVKPCQVGKGKRSVSMTLPSDLTRKLRLDPTGALFLLKVLDQNKFEIRILNTKDLDNYNENKRLSADHVTNPIQQTANRVVA